ncbi:MAG TPA: hypothetical protein VF665_10860 [Longimicrobium sp.]|uniref:hypothetical protein n=1 Tax=Longimicrobium sp. TaxID=2029185 RepID=UPI002ED949F1
MLSPEHPLIRLRLQTQARRRAAVAALWAAYAAYLALAVWGGRGNLAGIASVGALMVGLVCMVALAESSGLRAHGAPLHASRLAQRDRAYALSFHATSWLLVGVALYTQTAAHTTWLPLPSTPRAAAGAVAAVCVAIGMLPVTLLSWREPDPMPLDALPPIRPPLPLPRRDPRARPGDDDGPRWLH